MASERRSTSGRRQLGMPSALVAQHAPRRRIPGELRVVARVAVGEALGPGRRVRDALRDDAAVRPARKLARYFHLISDAVRLELREFDDGCRLELTDDGEACRRASRPSTASASRC
jgi:hypothetical protein